MKGQAAVQLPAWVQAISTLGLGTLLGVLGAPLVQGLLDRSTKKMALRQEGELQAVQIHHQKDSLELDHGAQHDRLALEHTHQRDMLVQAAHFEVRRETAELAGRALDWLSYEMLALHGHEVDMAPGSVPPPPYSAAGAIGDLRRIYVSHPTRAVRDLAIDLADSIGEAYNTLALFYSDPDQPFERPNSDKMAGWSKKIGQLVELINEPPASKLSASSPAR